MCRSGGTEPNRGGGQTRESGRGNQAQTAGTDVATGNFLARCAAGGGKPTTPRREHGDWSSNVALATAKQAGRNPRDLGQQLVDHLGSRLPTHVSSVDIAGPGFVNFHLTDSWLHEVLVDVVNAGDENYGRHDVGAGRSVNVEFVSANPTGPLHAGHGRWAAYGDSLSRLLERCGHEVHREFYVNDRGTQMQLYGASLAARKAGEDPAEDGYQGEYIAAWAAEMPEAVDPVEWGLDRAHRDQVAVLEAMHVVFDTWASEKAFIDIKRKEYLDIY